MTHSNFEENRLRGFGIARGRILAFSIDLRRRHYRASVILYPVNLDQVPYWTFVIFLPLDAVPRHLTQSLQLSKPFYRYFY